MRTSVRVAAILFAVAAALSGATPPRSRAFAIDGAIENPSNGHWYRIFPSQYLLSWTTCSANATALGGYLVTTPSAQEAGWVGSTFNLAANGPFFAGGSDAANEGTWVWTTGEPWTYSNWAPGEPTGGTSRNCLRIDQNGTWAAGVGGGTAVQSYIVEWDSDPNGGPPKTPPAAPSDLAGSVSSGSPISLSWTDNSDNEESFEIERRTSTTSYSRTGETGPNATLYEDIGTVPGTDYTYRVRAKNSGGVSDWSNEATVTASALSPGPRAPAELRVVSATRDSVELAWIDTSVDEIGFEVHRRRPGGAYALVASLPPGSWGFTDTSLPPDIEYEYGVRSMNAFRASGFCEVAAATLPTLSVTATRADLKDSPKFGRDSMKVQALFDFLPESPDGLFDVIAEGIGLRVGPVDRPVVMNLPKNLDTWKVKGTKATWKSAKGSTPKYSIQVDAENRTVKATASCLELPEPPVNPMRVSITVGDDGGSAKGDWETKKAGVFRLR